MSRTPIFWNARRDDVLMSMAVMGAAAGEIGEILDVPAESVALRLCVLRVRETPQIHEDEPSADDIGAVDYWRDRCAAIQARRETPEALLARIEEDEEIIAKAEARSVPSESLAGMCVAMARDRRKRNIGTLAEVETKAVLARVAPRRDGRS